MQPTSLAVTSTAPGADAPDAPAAPALTLAADTRSVRHLPQDEETMPRKTVGYILENGFELAPERGGWRALRTRVEDELLFADLEAAEESLGVSGVLQRWEDPRGRTHTRLLSPEDETPLSSTVESLGHTAFGKNQYGSKSIQYLYVLQAACYHCIRLAEAYAHTCRWHAAVELVAPEPVVPDRETLIAADEAYFEFDALVSALWRSYGSLRYLLWRVFADGSDTPPKNFEVTLNRLNSRTLPQGLMRFLQDHWSIVGKQVTQYRICVGHFVPVNAFGMETTVLRFEGEPIHAAMLIPDNPEVNDVNEFTYAKERDALSYGWGLLYKVLTFAVGVFGYLPDESRKLE
jgi:hypothetical protein